MLCDSKHCVSCSGCIGDLGPGGWMEACRCEAEAVVVNDVQGENIRERVYEDLPSNARYKEPQQSSGSAVTSQVCCRLSHNDRPATSARSADLYSGTCMTSHPPHTRPHQGCSPSTLANQSPGAGPRWHPHQQHPSHPPPHDQQRLCSWLAYCSCGGR